MNALVGDSGGWKWAGECGGTSCFLWKTFLVTFVTLMSGWAVVSNLNGL